MKKYLYTLLIGLGLFFGAITLASAVSIFNVQQGGTGAGTFTTGLLGGSLTNPFFTTATTTVSCAGTNTCTTFVALGAAPITITGSGANFAYPFYPLTVYGTSTSATSSSLWTAGVYYSSSTVATSTFANGLNVTGGCLAVNGTCVGSGGSGTVTSITASTPNSTLTLGGTNPITTSGTISFDLNLGNPNTWTVLQQFNGNASTTKLSVTNTAYFGSSATSTFNSAGVLNLASALTVANGGTGAATLTGCLTGNGTGAITGSGTCNTSAASVTSVGLSTPNSTLTVGSTPVTTSGTITADLNLAHTNTWTVLQNFYGNASTTGLSVSGKSFFGTSATTTIDTAGALTIATPNVNTIPNATTTNVSVSQSLAEQGNNIPPAFYPAFSFATTTAWAGTTTIQLGLSTIAETWDSIQCYTDVGTLNLQFYDGSNLLTMVKASTTAGTQPFTTNNAFTAGDKRKVDIGTPATAPTTVACTVKKHYTF